MFLCTASCTGLLFNTQPYWDLLSWGDSTLRVNSTRIQTFLTLNQAQGWKELSRASRSLSLCDLGTGACWGDVIPVWKVCYFI